MPRTLLINLTLILALGAAPATRLLKPDAPSDRDWSAEINAIPGLLPLGTKEAANQGPYKIQGFSAARCDGAIALLPLYRNAEGRHILRPMFADTQVTEGVIYKGDILSDFPALRFTLDQVKARTLSLLAPQPAPQAVAFVESGYCQLADHVARFVL